jgi:ribosomal protein S10
MTLEFPAEISEFGEMHIVGIRGSRSKDDDDVVDDIDNSSQLRGIQLTTPSELTTPSAVAATLKSPSQSKTKKQGKR